MERPVNYVRWFFFPSVREAAWVAIEEAISTIDQSDIRGSSRIIVIRRELPRTTAASFNDCTVFSVSDALLKKRRRFWVQAVRK
jgi:hypothetical protein